MHQAVGNAVKQHFDSLATDSTAGDRAAAVVDALQTKIAEVQQVASERLSEVAAKASEVAETVKEKASKVVGEVQARATEAKERATATIDDAQKQTSEFVADAQKAAKDGVEEVKDALAVPDPMDNVGAQQGEIQMVDVSDAAKLAASMSGKVPESAPVPAADKARSSSSPATGGTDYTRYALLAGGAAVIAWFLMRK
jgi:ElaB/YqjD/DUF883 family membrane-anchored ribosome-binding protein